MNYKNTFTFKVLQLFIISLLFIAFGITIGDDTLPLSFLLLFILGTAILIKGQSITIGNAAKTLFVFFIIAIVSVCYRLLFTTGVVVSFAGEVMHIKNFKQLTMLFIMILHFLILRNIFRKYDVKLIQQIVNFFILISFVVSLYSIYQFIAFQYNWPFTDILRTSKSYSITRGVETSSWAGLPRARAFMPEPSFWGTFLLIPFSLVLPFVFERKKMKLFLFIFIVAQFLTFSRSCWFGFLLILICFIFHKIMYEGKLIKTTKIFLGVTLTIFLLTVSIVPDKSVLFQRLSAFSDPSAIERLAVQKLTLQTFLKYPVLGIGWGNTPFFLQHQVTHNWYLQLLLETGIVGFSIFMLFLFQIWNKLKTLEKEIKIFLETESKELKSHILGLKLVFFSILLTWFNLSAYNLSYIWFFLALIAVLPITYRNIQNS